jgi:hypothetical protein
MLRAVELLLAAIILWFIITQVVIPLFGGRPLFPMFGTEAKLQEQLEKKRQELHNERIADAIRDLEKK